ncbi:hypothetical protein NDU88_003006 [Pleurodeles waltl]|uniref:Uncharacterized protein n=1 Tax=Pleurodeles waltl TaxID=8319 RepID=A0AAV7T4H2_PLEWA|nr:hypothetical protein NDU88_003006 [Pleurodeles waltl]
MGGFHWVWQGLDAEHDVAAEKYVLRQDDLLPSRGYFDRQKGKPRLRGTSWERAWNVLHPYPGSLWRMGSNTARRQPQEFPSRGEVAEAAQSVDGH